MVLSALLRQAPVLCLPGPCRTGSVLHCWTLTTADGDIATFISPDASPAPQVWSHTGEQHVLPEEGVRTWGGQGLTRSPSVVTQAQPLQATESHPQSTVKPPAMSQDNCKPGAWVATIPKAPFSPSKGLYGQFKYAPKDVFF